MSKSNKQSRGLGKGLSALMGLEDSDVIDIIKPSLASANSENYLPIELIKPNDTQPRKLFSQDSLRELADSIEVNGIIQPILVRRDPSDPSSYQIIAGERRWRASRMIGLKEVPVIIKNISDKETLELSLIENIQRQDLTLIEEAEGYKRLMEEFSYTQEKLAEAVGKSRSHIANLLRTLTLPSEILDHISSGELSMGHARALVGVPNNIEIADKIIRNQLNVRDTEKLTRAKNSNSKSNEGDNSFSERTNTQSSKDDDLVIIEKNISLRLGMKTEIEDTANGGKVIIHFHNLEQLDSLLKRLGE